MNVESIDNFVIVVFLLGSIAVIFYLYYRGKFNLLTEKLSQVSALNQELNSSLNLEKDKNIGLEEKANQIQTELVVEQQKRAYLQDQFEKEVKNSEIRRLEFESIANQVLSRQTASFNDHQQKEIKQLLEPLKLQIEKFEDKVVKTHQDSSEKIISLKEQIKQLSEKSDQVSQDANNLAKALKGDSKLQGNWGEIILESILEKSGLEKDREYVVQQSQRDENGRSKRPDIVIQLPDNMK